MSVEITTAFVKQFEAAVMHLVEQKMSRLRKAVSMRAGLVGESAFVEQLGSASSQVKTARHTPIIFSDTPHRRRRITSIFRDSADAIDGDDKLKILIANPSGEYAVAQARELGRQMDDILITGLSGTSFTGVDGATAVVLPATQKVAVNFAEVGAPGNSNMTLGKLRQVAEILTANEVDDEDRWGALNASMVHSLLFDKQLTSIDQNIVRPLTTGKIVDFMGFTLIPSQRLLGTNVTRKALFWHRDGIALGVWQDIQSNIDQRIDLRARPTQIYTSFQIGSTRLQEKMVVEVACDETADLTTT